jgi:hypothetical protein
MCTRIFWNDNPVAQTSPVSTAGWRSRRSSTNGLAVRIWWRNQIRKPAIAPANRPMMTGDDQPHVLPSAMPSRSATSAMPSSSAPAMSSGASVVALLRGTTASVATSAVPATSAPNQ